ncbi:MAG: flavodoxin family protein [Desulfobacterales bacterium]|nr:flavodoxin family protein [Desulfobacterales bacterium]
MKSKVLIVLGSPRKKGNTATLAAQVAQAATENGAEVETVYLNGLKIKPCQGCGKCQREPSKGCILKDDMGPLYGKLQEADSVVVASPIYFFNLSAQTKIFIDRLYAVGTPRTNILKGKHFSILLSYADPDPFASGAVNALRSFQDTCSYVGAHIEGMIYGRANDAGEIKNNTDVMEQASALGKRLAAMHAE